MVKLLHLLLSLAGWLTIVAALDCEPDSSFCKCTASDGSMTIDIRHVGLTYPAQYEDTEENYFYYYTPCSPMECGSGERSTVCQEADNQEGAQYAVARYTNFEWTITNTDPDNLEFKISYGGGDEAKGIVRSAVITFKKGTPGTAFTFDREDNEQFIYYFNVVGKGVAPYNGNSGGKNGGSDNVAGPIGLVIIFLALIALVAYFVVGGIYMYQVKGARGMEVIPNFAFWKDFPFLIKDGFFFTISPCYKRSDKYQSF